LAVKAKRKTTTSTNRPHFDREAAEKACAFFSKYLRHTKGRWGPSGGRLGQPFELFPWQREVVSKLFGTLRADGSRQYRNVYVEIPKKNGKSELAAGIALKLLFADGEAGADIFSAAADRDQAAIVFNVAAEMVEQSSALSKKCKIIHSTKRIVHNTNGGVYRVLSAEVKTKHGFNTHGVIFDELHAQPSRDLYDVLTKGAGDARRQPVFFMITTAGYDRHSICWEVHEYARQVKAGIIKDPSFLPILYGAPEEADWRDPKVWAACNPSMDVHFASGGGILKTEDIADACKRAQESPAEENTFRRLRLNQWVKQESRYLPMVAWDACGEPFDAAPLLRRPCYAGLDLASSIDVAALLLVFGDPDGLIRVLCRFWVPEDGIEKRSRTDKVPYDQWARDGFIKATPGNVIDYSVIRHDLNELSKVYAIQEVAFDRWGAVQISQDLIDDGFTMVDFGQGYKSMSPPTKELLKQVLAGKLRHGGHPVLRWMADNTVVVSDPAENVKPDKSKSTERIDGVVALIMALDRLTRKEGPSIYESRGVVSI
jgi:phage terminase large subunit-like protein